MYIRRGAYQLLLGVVAAAVLAGACGGKAPPVARPTPPPSSGPTTTPPAPPGPPAPIRETPVVPAPVVPDDSMASRSVDDLNRDSPLKAIFFEYDSAELTADARTLLDANATILKRYGTWMITIEGHCDERGTAEYNLALGERRAVAAQSYLVSLGIPAERLRTVSYGKEFPFDPGHDEAAYTKNRRSHFVITGK
ncbi:MAG: peptidoglycan-associated lipoprotein Pal [Acidobacteria bacterium]|nr:peptidoglycan-associated lipoprotein Pal [Acidobacteriota bacterium]